MAGNQFLPPVRILDGGQRAPDAGDLFGTLSCALECVIIGHSFCQAAAGDFADPVYRPGACVGISLGQPALEVGCGLVVNTVKDLVDRLFGAVDPAQMFRVGGCMGQQFQLAPVADFNSR